MRAIGKIIEMTRGSLGRPANIPININKPPKDQSWHSKKPPKITHQKKIEKPTQKHQFLDLCRLFLGFIIYIKTWPVLSLKTRIAQVLIMCINLSNSWYVMTVVNNTLYSSLAKLCNFFFVYHFIYLKISNLMQN